MSVPNATPEQLASQSRIQRRALLLAHREQRGGRAAETTGCSCGWSPAIPAEAARRAITPSGLQQYADHVGDELTAARLA